MRDVLYTWVRSYQHVIAISFFSPPISTRFREKKEKEWTNRGLPLRFALLSSLNWAYLSVGLLTTGCVLERDKQPFLARVALIHLKRALLITDFESIFALAQEVPHIASRVFNL